MDKAGEGSGFHFPGAIPAGGGVTKTGPRQSTNLTHSNHGVAGIHVSTKEFVLPLEPMV